MSDMDDQAGPALADNAADLAPSGLSSNLHMPWATTLAYAVLGTAWIAGSDHVLGLLIEPEYWGQVRAQTAKGTLFILVTAGSLYLIMSYYAKRIGKQHAALLRAEASFRDFAESTSDWMWERGPDLRLTRLIGQGKEVAGKDLDTLIDRSLDAVLASSEPAVRDRLKRDFEARRPFRDVVYPHTDETGGTRYFRVSGKPIYDAEGQYAGHRGASTEVTREIKLRQMRDGLAAIIEATPDLVATATVDGQLVYINRAGREMLGIEPDVDVSSLTLEDVTGPDAAAYLRDVVMPAAVANGSWSGAMMKLRDRHGRTRTVSQVVLAHEEVDYLSTIVRDLTDELHSQERLRQAQKMDALGQLTGGVAHDLNNLLVVVLGNGELLAERMKDDASGRELAEMIVRAADRGSDLTHRLLAFARQQALRPERVDPGEMLVSMEHLLARTLGEHIEIDIGHVDDPWPVFVDKGELETCVLNLAINARDAMPDGGTLTIEMANEHIDETDVLGEPDLKPGDYVVLSVRDTGTGMAPEVLERIFDPFFTTKGDAKGTGLGLSMVYGFVQQSGGKVSVYSEPGRGSVFRLYLPPAAAQTDEAARDALDTGTPRGDGELILVAEDDPLVRSYTCERLRALGYRVHEADNGPAALAQLDKEPEVDLLLTDIVMPGGLSGPDVAREAHRRFPELKVLYMSGYPRHSGQAGDTSEADAAILRKPFRRHSLAQAVRDALDAAP